MAATTLFGEVSFWDLRTRRPLGPPQTAHVGPVWTPTFSRDGRWMATARRGPDRAALGRAPPPAGREAATPGSFVDDVGLSPDGKTLAVTTGSRARPGIGRDLLRAAARPHRRSCAAPWGRWGRFSPDGRLLVVADHEGRLQLFDTETWKPRTRPVIAHRGEILSANVSPDSRTLATTSLDGSTRLWDLASGRPIGEGAARPPAAAQRGGLRARRHAPRGRLRRRPRVALGPAAVVMGQARVQRRRTDAHARRVDGRAAGPRLRPSLPRALRRNPATAAHTRRRTSKRVRSAARDCRQGRGAGVRRRAIGSRVAPASVRRSGRSRPRQAPRPSTASHEVLGFHIGAGRSGSNPTPAIVLSRRAAALVARRPDRLAH